MLDNNIGLIYANSSHRGPGKVVTNLSKGLEELGYKFNKVTSQNIDSFNLYGVLQFSEPNLIEKLQSKNKVLMGPNLFVLPNENSFLVENFNNFVVPAQWVKSLYYQCTNFISKNCNVWPVGIETDIWSPDVESKIESDINCFIYYKNRNEQDLQIVQAICKKFNLKYKLIEYGKYNEEQLKTVCEEINSINGFAILLTGTESQGIAYMQILSHDIPCYVFDFPYWKSDDSLIKVSATSVPYFDYRCGSVANRIDLEHFESFLNNVKTHSYAPRQYILENHTLLKAAKNYVNILESINV